MSKLARFINRWIALHPTFTIKVPVYKMGMSEEGIRYQYVGADDNTVELIGAYINEDDNLTIRCRCDARLGDKYPNVTEAGRKYAIMDFFQRECLAMITGKPFPKQIIIVEYE